MKEIKFYKAENGEIIISDENFHGFAELKAGEIDASLEKHVPAIKHEDGKLIVDVGSIEHPMIEAHYIKFVVLNSERGAEVIHLSPGNKPHAEFVDVEHGTVYEYCNLHGLWKKEF